MVRRILRSRIRRFGTGSRLIGFDVANEWPVHGIAPFLIVQPVMLVLGVLGSLRAGGGGGIIITAPG